MKNSKFILLLVMVVTLLIPARSLASDKDSLDVSIPIKVDFDSEESQEFSFILEAKDPSNPVPSQTNIKVKDQGAFGPISFDLAGKYSYTIKQVVGDDTNIEYDDRIYNLDVYIQNADKGFDSSLVVTMVSYKDDPSKKIDELVFENKLIKTEPKVKVVEKKVVKKGKQTSSQNPKMGVEALYLPLILASLSILALLFLRRRKQS